MTRYELSGLLLVRTVYGWTTLWKSDPIGALARRMKWLSKPRVITKASQPLQCPDRKARGPGPGPFGPDRTGSPQSTSYRHWLSTVEVLTIWTTRTESSGGHALACEAPGACYRTRQNGRRASRDSPSGQTYPQRSD
jgi:hypothetical protein